MFHITCWVLHDVRTTFNFEDEPSRKFETSANKNTYAYISGNSLKQNIYFFLSYMIIAEVA